MKKSSIILVLGLLIQIALSHRQESLALRANTNVTPYRLSTTLLKKDPILMQHKYYSDSARVHALPDSLFAQYSVDQVLTPITQPSSQFISRYYTFLQKREETQASDLAKIAALRYTPLSILMALSTSDDEEILCALAINPSISSEIADRLLAKRSDNIELGLALNPSFARLNPSAAGELIATLSQAPHHKAVYSKTTLKRLFARNNYFGIAKRLLSLRGDTQAATSAKRFVQHIDHAA